MARSEDQRLDITEQQRCQMEDCDRLALSDFLGKLYCADHLSYRLSQVQDDLATTEDAIRSTTGVDRLRFMRLRQKIHMDAERGRVRLMERDLARQLSDKLGLPVKDSSASSVCRHGLRTDSCYWCGNRRSPSELSTGLKSDTFDEPTEHRGHPSQTEETRARRLKPYLERVLNRLRSQGYDDPHKALAELAMLYANDQSMENWADVGSAMRTIDTMISGGAAKHWSMDVLEQVMRELFGGLSNMDKTAAVCYHCEGSGDCACVNRGQADPNCSECEGTGSCSQCGGNGYTEDLWNEKLYPYYVGAHFGGVEDRALRPGTDPFAPKGPVEPQHKGKCVRCKRDVFVGDAADFGGGAFACSKCAPLIASRPGDYLPDRVAAKRPSRSEDDDDDDDEQDESQRQKFEVVDKANPWYRHDVCPGCGHGIAWCADPWHNKSETHRSLMRVPLQPRPGMRYDPHKSGWEEREEDEGYGPPPPPLEPPLMTIEDLPKRKRKIPGMEFHLTVRSEGIPGVTTGIHRFRFEDRLEAEKALKRAIDAGFNAELRPVRTGSSDEDPFEELSGRGCGRCGSPSHSSNRCPEAAARVHGAGLAGASGLGRGRSMPAGTSVHDLENNVPELEPYDTGERPWITDHRGEVDQSADAAVCLFCGDPMEMHAVWNPTHQ